MTTARSQAAPIDFWDGISESIASSTEKSENVVWHQLKSYVGLFQCDVYIERRFRDSVQLDQALSLAFPKDYERTLPGKLWRMLIISNAEYEKAVSSQRSCSFERG
jgi:hypothetical protein